MPRGLHPYPLVQNPNSEPEVYLDINLSREGPDASIALSYAFYMTKEGSRPLIVLWCKALLI